MCECIRRLVVCGYSYDEAASLCYSFIDAELFVELEIFIDAAERRALEGIDHVARV